MWQVAPPTIKPKILFCMKVHSYMRMHRLEFPFFAAASSSLGSLNMPLLTMTGYPSSGKTCWATKIKAAFDGRIAQSSDPRISKVKVVLINDECLRIDKMDYSDSRREKSARGLLFSAVERHLGKECIVICDGLNYIKGFRYQLSCSAKAVGTPHCLVSPRSCAIFLGMIRLTPA